MFLIDDVEGAKREYAAAIPVLLEHDALFDAITALRYHSQAIVSAGDPVAALEPCARALRLAREHGFVGEELDARRTDALLRIANGDLDAAKTALTDYANRAKDVESRVHEATAERDFGALEYAQDRFEAARTRLERALAISESNGDLVGAAESHMRLATIAARVGDAIAMEFHAGAVLGNRPDADLIPLDLHLLLQRAEARMQLGDLEPAREDLRRAITLAGERGQLDLVCGGLRLRSKFHADLGDHDSALADALESARVGARIEDQNAVSAGHILAAQIRFDRGDDAGATTELDIAEPIVESKRGTFFFDAEYEAYIRLVRCGIAYRADDLESAENHASRALEVARENGSADLERQAALLFATIELDRARRLDGEARAARLASAESCATEALASADRAGSTPLRLGPLTVLVEVALLRNDLGEARAHHDDALATLESIAGDDAAAAFGVEIASRARAGHAGLFALAQDLAVSEIESAESPTARAALIERAFTQLTRYQGRALAEGIVELRAGLRSREGALLRRRIAEIDSTVDRALRRASEALHDGDSELAMRERAVAEELRSKREIAAAELRDAEPRRITLLSPPTATPDALRAAGAVSARAALAAYVAGTERTFAYLVTDRGVALIPIATTAELAAAVARFLGEIAEPNSLGGPTTVRATGRALAKLAIDPVLARLPIEATELIVVPSAQLAHVPFEALVLDRSEPKVDDPRANDFSNIPFAIDRLDIRYSPAVPVLLELANEPTRKGGGRACIVADSAGGLGLPPLANAILEAESVANRFVEPARFFDENATRSVLAGDLRRYSIFHFASHALAFTAPPLVPGLVLRNDDGEPSIFGIGDVLDLELDADLVVLSACSTNAGEVRPGEGVESLARAFLFAGARNVVASLFPLSDSAALATIDDFYRRLADSPTDPAIALLATKRAIRRGEIVVSSPSPSRGVGAVRAAPRGVPSGHPFHWAPLVVIGK